jgi:flagellar protein FliJ
MPPFTLDAVLNYRLRQEDIAQYRYAEATRLHAAIEARLTGELATFAEVLHDRERRQREGVAISELLFYEERLTYLDNTIKAIRRTLAEKAALVKLEQENLLQKSRERQVMEKLRDQQKQGLAGVSQQEGGGDVRRDRRHPSCRRQTLASRQRGLTRRKKT